MKRSDSGVLLIYRSTSYLALNLIKYENTKKTLADEWNEWNGFVLTILGIYHKTKGFEGELLGLHFSKDHLIFEIAFIQFTVKSPFL